MKSVRFRRFCGSYFSAFRLNTGKYAPEKLRTGTFQAVNLYQFSLDFFSQQKHLSRENLKEATLKYLSKVLGEKLLLKLVSRIANVQLTILTRKDSMVVNFLKHAFSLVS